LLPLRGSHTVVLARRSTEIRPPYDEDGMSDVLMGVRKFVETKAAMRRVEATVADDESLFAAGVIDSMGIFELVTFLEDRFNVRIEDEEILKRNFESISRIADFIGRKLIGAANDAGPHP
jgi:acyl carrier protein